jgi:hypothetical protein
MLSVNNAMSIMPSLTNEPIMLSIVMLNVVMLSVIVLSVVAPSNVPSLGVQQFRYFLIYFHSDYFFWCQRYKTFFFVTDATAK